MTLYHSHHNILVICYSCYISILDEEANSNSYGSLSLDRKWTSRKTCVLSGGHPVGCLSWCQRKER